MHNLQMNDEYVISSKAKELQEAITAYQQQGRPRSVRNAIALDNIGLIHWALNFNGFKRHVSKSQEEIEQEAFIILLESIESYDETRGNFTTYLAWNMKQIYRRALNYQQEQSLNEPIPGIEDDIERIDTIEDEEALNFVSSVEDDDERNAIRAILARELSPEELNIVLSFCGITREKKTIQQLAEATGLSRGKVQYIYRRALKNLRYSKELQAIYAQYESVDLFRSGSVISWNNSGGMRTSPTEYAAMKRIELEERAKKVNEAKAKRTQGRVSKIENEIEEELKRNPNDTLVNVMHRVLKRQTYDI